MCCLIQSKVHEDIEKAKFSVYFDPNISMKNTLKLANYSNEKGDNIIICDVLHHFVLF